MSDGFTHDFDKAITEVFGLPIYWYGAAYTLGFLGVLIWFSLRRSRLGWPMAHVLDVSIFLAVGVLLGGRIFDILVYEFGYYAAQPWLALNWWRGGLASHGVILGGFLSVFIFSRLHGQPLLKVTDELVVPVAFLLAVGRLGNFIEGGVIGTVTTMPWGVHYSDLEGARHPVALYESAKNLLIVPVAAVVLKRFPAGRGVATALFVLLYAGLRFGVDLLRDYEADFLGLDTGQYFNLAMAFLGIGLLIWSLRRPVALSGAPVIAARPAGLIRPLVFAFLCLYPLGIPTSWTQVNIEQKRQEQQSGANATSWPNDPHEQQPQPQAPGRVDVFHPGDSAVQMGAEVGVDLPVLARWAVAGAIPQGRFQPVVFTARDVDMAVDGQARDALAIALVHDAGFAVVHRVALIGADRRRHAGEPAAPRREIPITREGEIVAVAGVACAQAPCQPVQPAIQPPGAEIGQHRRGRRALRQMLLQEQAPGFAVMPPVRGQAVEQSRRRRRAA
jgi:phosphatidylglycerol:prolipoprotein diacylglycerol transferase